MIAAELDIGPNLSTFLLAALVLVPQVLPLILGRRAKVAAEDAATTAAETKQTVEKIAGEFSNNGGSTLLDKIQAGQMAIADTQRVVSRSISELADATRHTAARVDALHSTVGGVAMRLDHVETIVAKLPSGPVPITEQKDTPT